MQNEELIPAADFCTHYHTEISFIETLSQMGLINVTTIEASTYIHTTELQQLEQYTRMHYDLNINTEGIDAIYHLLDRVKNMQQEITLLKNKLRMYESE